MTWIYQLELGSLAKEDDWKKVEPFYTFCVECHSKHLVADICVCVPANDSERSVCVCVRVTYKETEGERALMCVCVSVCVCVCAKPTGCARDPDLHRQKY